MNTNPQHNNPLLNRFNDYRTKAINNIPFDNNNLIQSDIRIINNIASKINHNGGRSENKNIIKQMLKPVKVDQDNSDVMNRYEQREAIRKRAMEGDIGIKPTNIAYKPIVKDEVNKPIEEMTKEDLIVHRVVQGVDNDKKVLKKEFRAKNDIREKTNESLAIEFSIENYDRHKKAFEYNEAFIRNMAYEEKIFEDNKADCIEFYKRKQKEMEGNETLIDGVLRKLLDTGAISKDEIPS